MSAVACAALGGAERRAQTRGMRVPQNALKTAGPERSLMPAEDDVGAASLSPPREKRIVRAANAAFRRILVKGNFLGLNGLHPTGCLGNKRGVLHFGLLPRECEFGYVFPRIRHLLGNILTASTDAVRPSSPRCTPCSSSPRNRNRRPPSIGRLIRSMTSNTRS